MRVPLLVAALSIASLCACDGAFGLRGGNVARQGAGPDGGQTTDADSGETSGSDGVSCYDGTHDTATADSATDHDPAACDDAECGPQMGMPNWLCDDGVTVAGPGPCERGADGVCAWSVVTCPTADTGSDGRDTCPVEDCGPALGMPDTLCPDGVHYSGPTGVCLVNADGTCGWEIASCP